MLTQNDYQAAVRVQDAVNLSGVIFSLADIVRRLCDEANAGGKGTQWKNHHPIVRLFAETIADKCGAGGGGFESWGHAYDFCKAAAEGRGAILVIPVGGGETVEYQVEGVANETETIPAR